MHVAETELDEVLVAVGEYLGDEPPALSLPPQAFTSTELWGLEQDRIFRRSWLIVTRADQLAGVGDYQALTVAGEPVLVVRDSSGLRAFSAVCRHRYMPIVECETGNTDVFTCPYHSWRYGLDGRLRGAPFMAANPDFDARSCRLPSFAVEEYEGFIWLNLDAGAEPISARLAPTVNDFANYRLSEMIQVESWTMTWQTNWKLAMENLYENYHVIGLHQHSLAPFSLPGGGDIDVRRYSPAVTHIRIPLAIPVPGASLELTEAQRSNVMMLMSFPASGLLALADRVAWFGVVPTAVDQIHIRGGILATVESAGREDIYSNMMSSMVDINEEDRAGVEAVQRGAGSRYAKRGNLSPKEAPGILAFYQNLAHALLGERTSG